MQPVVTFCYWHVKIELGQNVFVYCCYSLELYTEWEQGVLSCSPNKTKKLLGIKSMARKSKKVESSFKHLGVN